jgi:hypothetical protein
MPRLLPKDSDFVSDIYFFPVDELNTAIQILEYFMLGFYHNSLIVGMYVYSNWKFGSYYPPASPNSFSSVLIVALPPN